MNAFEDETAITSVTISDGITTIGDSAFRGCSILETVNIG
ncbi:MAG: leucine-rich repeat domain-containing protein, partial [Desulfobulbus sp.]